MLYLILFYALCIFFFAVCIFFYVQAAIYMLQGRDSENSKVVAKSMTQGERNKLLKTLRNRHTNWKNSRSEDSQVLYTILQEGRKQH